MVSKRLRKLLLVCIPLFMLHGIEEYATGFYNVDVTFRFLVRPLNALSVQQVVFLTFQVWLLLLLFISFLLLLGRVWILRVMAVLGLFLILEPLHILEAAVSGKYYPGMVTAFLFPPLAFLFWKELLKEFAVKVEPH